MTSAQTAIEFIRISILALTGTLEGVLIEAMPNAMAITVRVTVPAPLVGKIVGKQGRHARALRMILTAHGKEIGTPIGLDLITGKEHC